MAESPLVGTPVAIHLDEKLEEDRFLEELLYIFARERAHALKGRTGATDDDALLALPLAVDDRRNLDEILSRLSLVVGASE